MKNQRSTTLKIRVCDKNSVPLAHKMVSDKNILKKKCRESSRYPEPGGGGGRRLEMI